MKKIIMLAVIVLAAFSLSLKVNAVFTDDSAINHSEAVNMLVAIGVIDGYEDGSFRPHETISRAEIAKILCMILNGGREPGEFTESGFGIFGDVYGHWAEKYINYIASLGIVSGYGSGRFGPSDTITVQQLFKMLLVCLNYDPEIEQLEGLDWAFNTDDLAYQIGLNKGLDHNFDSAGTLTRDTAAQIIVNALYADRIMYTYDDTGSVKAKVRTKTSIMESSFDAKVVTGVVIANKFGVISRDAETASEGYYLEHYTLIDTGLIDGAPSSSITPFITPQSTSILGSAMTVVINRSTNEVYGMTDAGIGSDFTIDFEASWEETVLILEQNGLILNDAPLCVNFVPNGMYSGNKAGRITRFVDYNGDSVIDVALSVEPFVALYDGTGTLSFADDAVPFEYGETVFQDRPYEPNTPVLCTVFSGVNYVKNPNFLVGFVENIELENNRIQLSGEYYTFSSLWGSLPLNPDIEAGNIIFVYLDDSGYVIAYNRLD